MIIRELKVIKHCYECINNLPTKNGFYFIVTQDSKREEFKEKFKINQVRVVSYEKFDQKRPDYEEGADNSMSVTYVTSDWTNKPEVKKSKTDKPKPSVTTPTTEPTPSVEPTTTTTPEEPKTTELPQPKTQTKPEKVVSKPEPTQTEPETTEPKTQELPQPKQTEKPVANPEEDEENKNLQESIKNIKRLMFS